MTAKRLEKIQEYYFSTKLKEIAGLKELGRDIINLGIGSPDLPPPQPVLQTMQEVVQRANAHQYQSYRGTKAFRKAISGFYKKYYGVNVNEDTEVLPLLGSKEGIMHISMAFLNDGDEVLLPDPGYMTYRAATLLAGGIPVYYNLTEENGYLPDLNALEKQDLSRVKLMWINYPHMPTGAPASLSLFQDLVDFARAHHILLVNDNPYSFILNDQPISVLQVPGAMVIAMELNSLSKSHNMAGWRVGMLLGNETHINAVMKFKSQMDSGMFLGTQMAAISALQIGDEWYENLNKIYEKRKALALEICNQLGMQVTGKQTGMFLWAKLPEGVDSKRFTDKLLAEKNIFIAPGFIFGQHSDNYVRISLTNDEKVLREVLKRVMNN